MSYRLLKSEDIEYRISRRNYFSIEVVTRIIYGAIGVSLAYFVLYKKCLFCVDCNPIVTGFFCILSLSCFSATGLPIDKVINIKVPLD
ncbi:MAG: hypothetical protein HY769_10485 [Candidatus Stahlbacteria bacterium]|nr:hypothetical protein [Candidatus Stahlbacteria bacterium]